MGCSRSRQGSAAFWHARGGARQGIALVAAFVVVLLAAPPAMAGTATVEGTTLRYQAFGEVNNVTVTQGDGSYTISDTAPVQAGSGCTADAGGAVCPADPPIDQIWVNVGNGDDTVVVVASTPAQIFGRAGNDVIDVQDGDLPGGVRDTVDCGDGADSVRSDRADFVLRPACEINDDGVPPATTILAGPLGPPGNATPHFNFEADEAPVQFFCAIAPAATPPDQLPWSGCAPNQTFDAPTEGDWVFRVYAQDDVEAESPPKELAFVVDKTPPTVTISGPASPIATSTPTFEITADEPKVSFDCALDGGAFSRCDASFTTLPLPDGDHVLEVRGTDPGRNETIAAFPFRVSMPGPNGVAPNAPGTPAAPRRIIIDSLVLISGAGVRMSRRGVVGIKLHCAGKLRCSGRLTITTAEPISRKRRKLVRLGSTKFTIGANKKRTVKVRFSKSKRRLARRLKRFKAKAVITEVDQRGNKRISSRVFFLRAR